MQELIDFIKSTRKKKKLSTYKLSELSGVSQSFLSHLENGRKKNPPSPEIIKKLAMALGVDYFGLMRMAGYMDINQVPEITIEEATNFLTTEEKLEILKIDKLNFKRLEKRIAEKGIDNVFFTTIKSGTFPLGGYLKILRLSKDTSLHDLSVKSEIAEDKLRALETGNNEALQLNELIKVGEALEINNLCKWLVNNVNYQFENMDIIFSRYDNPEGYDKTTVSFEVTNIERVNIYGVEISRIIPEEELKERFFSINHLLEREGNVYYNDRVLSDHERSKVRKMLEILLED